jgi:hypothetical protein
MRCFASGDHALEEAPRAGRPRLTEHVDEIRRLSEDDPFISQKKLEKTLDLRHTPVKRIWVEVLSPRKVDFKWIPYQLNEAQNAERV